MTSSSAKHAVDALASRLPWRSGVRASRGSIGLRWTALAVACFLAGAPEAPAERSERRPNIVVILADDLGYGDVSSYGASWVPTPNIDALAKKGVLFTDAYVTSAVCSPSRAGLLTGRYQQRFGHEFNPGHPEHETFGLPLNETTLAESLQREGYRTAAIGKWHLGSRTGFHPLDRGFDEFFGLLSGGGAYVTAEHGSPVSAPSGRDPGSIVSKRGDPDDGGNWHRSPIYRNRTVVAESRYLTEAFAEEAVAFLGRETSQPCFLYLAPNAVHTPLHATRALVDRVPAFESERQRVLGAMIVALDDLVGRVMSAVDRNTLVFFLSDNGSPLVIGAGSNGDLAGEKGTCFEGGIRVPFIVSWPEELRGDQVVRYPVSSLDIFPSAMEAAGAEIGSSRDGVSLWPWLRSEVAPDRALYWRSGDARAIRRDKWKLLQLGDRFSALYDLENDRGETTDCSAERPEVVEDLRRAWKAWNSEMQAPKWPGNLRPLSVRDNVLEWPN